MSDFETLVAGVLKHEGGYVNHPSDRGGATNYGITQRVYDGWRKEQNLPVRDVSLLTQADAVAIYHRLYWMPARCGSLPDAVRAIHFDSAVNHGVKRAGLLLQDAADVFPRDGIVGPATIVACAGTYAPLLLARYIAARYRFYGAIIQNDRSQLVFMAGWMRRMQAFA